MLRQATENAKKAFRETGERCYVMPYAGRTGKPQLLIIDRKNFRRLKHKGYISPEARLYHVQHECFYATPYRNGSEELSPEGVKALADAYYKWYEQQMAIYKAKKKRNKEIQKERDAVDHVINRAQRQVNIRRSVQKNKRGAS